jgi:hypothetical protein
MKPVVVKALTVTQEIADEFYTVIREAIYATPVEWLDELYIVDIQLKSVVFSFDGQWKPFVGFTKGFNLPEKRTPMTSSYLTDFILDSFDYRSREIPGGRVHLTEAKAFFRDLPSASRKDLCLFDWQGAEPFTAVKNMQAYIQNKKNTD